MIDKTLVGLWTMKHLCSIWLFKEGGKVLFSSCTKNILCILKEGVVRIYMLTTTRHKWDYLYNKESIY